MFNFIKVGRLLEEGINLYQHKNHTQAREVFRQALALSPHDFAATFWLARTHTRLGEYELAQEMLTKCLKLKPDVSELLIAPWHILNNGLKTDYPAFSSQLEQYDAQADIALHNCYFKKEYTIGEVIKVSLLLMSLLIVAEIFYLSWGYLGKLLAAFLMLIIILGYFHFNTPLPLNLWRRYHWVKEQIQRLLQDRSFICLNGLIVLWAVANGVGLIALSMKILPQLKIEMIEAMQNDLLRQPMAWICIWPITLMAGVYEEFVYRLVWYNYLEKYGKIFANVVVSILFMLSHMEMSPHHFLLSLIYTWSYVRYQTLLAPIVVHIVYNFFVMIFLLLRFKLLLP